MTTTHITVRKALPEDESFFVQLYISTRQEEVAAWGWTEEQLDHFLRMQFSIQQQSYSLQYPAAEHHIIMENHIPIGRMILQHRQHEILLVDLSLLQTYRNKGIGTALLTEMQEKAASNHHSIRLHVFHSNPAQRLYERLGFQKISEESLYIRMQWQPGCRALIHAEKRKKDE